VFLLGKVHLLWSSNLYVLAVVVLVVVPSHRTSLHWLVVTSHPTKSRRLSWPRWMVINVHVTFVMLHCVVQVVVAVLLTTNYCAAAAAAAATTTTTTTTTINFAFSAFTLLVGHQEEHMACKN